MASKTRSGSVQRDRHGRGLRQTSAGGPRPAGAKASSFEEIVGSTCEFLINAWPQDLADLEWEVADAPTITQDSQGVRRWAAKRDQMKIVIYRLPIERLGHHRRTDRQHERMHIEEFVFAAVGSLIGKDPWELAPNRYSD